MRFAQIIIVTLMLVAAPLFGAGPAAALSLMDPFNVGPALDGGVEDVGKDLAYAPGERHTLDIYAPETRDKPAPVVVFLYGGAWKQGTKADYQYVGHAFAARGFVTVIPDYRLVPDTAYPGFLQDNAAAIKWVEDHIGRYGGDAKRIFLVGHSAGAYNAVVLGMDSSFLTEAGATIPIRGVAGLSGPYAVYPFEVQELQDAFGKVDNPQLTQPINLPTEEAVPLFLGQGTTDLIVSPDNTKELADKLTAAGRAVTVKYYDGLGHMEVVFAFSSLWRWRGSVLDDVVGFMEGLGAFDPAVLGPVDLVDPQDEAAQAIDQAIAEPPVGSAIE